MNILIITNLRDWSPMLGVPPPLLLGSEPPLLAKPVIHLLYCTVLYCTVLYCTVPVIHLLAVDHTAQAVDDLALASQQLVAELYFHLLQRRQLGYSPQTGNTTIKPVFKASIGEILTMPHQIHVSLLPVLGVHLRLMQKLRIIYQHQNCMRIGNILWLKSVDFCKQLPDDQLL